jgi:agmatine deiminase
MTTYRLPAEWEPHEAVWFAWPHNNTDWPGKFAAIPWVYGEMVRLLTPDDEARIIVADEAQEERARRVLDRCGADMSAIRFYHAPMDRSWTRDCCPAFVELTGGGEEKGAAVLFRFNGWAKYKTHLRDALVTARVAEWAGLKSVAAMREGRRVVLEGGAIDVNGRGTILTTEECLLSKRKQVRNPGLGKKDYEELFAEYFGATNTLWLGCGVAGDDTHGHVDDVCRFVNRDTVVLCMEDNPKDENYAPLRENRERLTSMRLEDGAKIQVAELPMPGPLYYEGLRLPASYANFLIGNKTVLVPTFNDPNDRIALGLLGDLFPDRVVRGIHAVDLVLGLGSVHCLTHEQAACS